MSPDELDDCFCGDPVCVNPWHVAKMARDACIAQGSGDPLVAVATLGVIVAALLVFALFPPPTWMFLPAMAALVLRQELLLRRRNG